MAVVEIDISGKKEKVRIFSIKVTPSMKNVVYSVYIIFTETGVYVPKQSKCDCPNGWLFCSHTLAFLLVIYLIQGMADWKFNDVKAFLPLPIKSLQSVPLSAGYVFGEPQVSKSGPKMGVSKEDARKKKSSEEKEDDIISTIAKTIAKDVPGYSDKHTIDEDDAAQETELMDSNLGEDGSKEEKSVDLCQKVDDKVKGSSDDNSTGKKTGNKTKVMMSDITRRNNELVNVRDSNEAELRKLLSHERLYSMMKAGLISKDKTLWFYLDHYASDRATRIEELRAPVEEEKEWDGPRSQAYDADFLRDYFTAD